MRIEIYDRETKEVVETTECNNLEEFRTYWVSQCNTQEYGYRVLDQETPA